MQKSSIKLADWHVRRKWATGFGVGQKKEGKAGVISAMGRALEEQCRRAALSWQSDMWRGRWRQDCDLLERRRDELGSHWL